MIDLYVCLLATTSTIATESFINLALLSHIYQLKDPAMSVGVKIMT